MIRMKNKIEDNLHDLTPRLLQVVQDEEGRGGLDEESRNSQDKDTDPVRLSDLHTWRRVKKTFIKKKKTFRRLCAKKKECIWTMESVWGPTATLLGQIKKKKRKKKKRTFTPTWGCIKVGSSVRRSNRKSGRQRRKCSDVLTSISLQELSRVIRWKEAST